MVRGVRFWALMVAMGGLAVSASYGCSSDDDEGGGTGAAAGSGGSSAAGAGTSSGATAGDESGGTPGSGATGAGAGTGTGGTFVFGETECTDGEDNDGDGEVDAADMHCVGPADDDESSFSTGISGDNMDPNWQDCFFDGDSGAGNDGCRYHTDCITGELSSDHEDCTVSDECQEFCGQFVPNGCDCFGCCEVFQDGVAHTIYLASCTDSNDLSTCTECTPDSECGNPCDTCELCLGKTELPPECTPQGEGGAPPEVPQCPTDQTPCSETQPCPANFWCLTGCCIPSPA